VHRAGDRVGAYALLREIKRSPDACLWLADRADGKARGPDVVAIRLANSPESCVRLEREYQRLVAVGTPSAPATVGFVSGHDNGSGALSTEWIPGLDLIEVLRARDQGAVTIDIAAALELTLRLIRAITPIHTREVRLLHGAIWADQIRFDAHGEMHLTGWGNWNPPGGSDWEAPELREGATPTAALDAWGVGRVAVQLLVSPRKAGLARADRLALLKKENPAVARWVGSLLAQDPSHRPALNGLVERDVLALQRKRGGVADVIGLLNHTREWLVERRVDAGPSDPLDLFRPTEPGGPAWMGDVETVSSSLPVQQVAIAPAPPPPSAGAIAAPSVGEHVRVVPVREAPSPSLAAVAPRSSDWSDVAPISANIQSETISPVEVEATDDGFDAERAFFEEPITEEEFSAPNEPPASGFPGSLEEAKEGWRAMLQTEQLAAAMIGVLLLALFAAILQGTF